MCRLRSDTDFVNEDRHDEIVNERTVVLGHAHEESWCYTSFIQRYQSLLQDHDCWNFI